MIDSQMPKIIMNYTAKGKIKIESAREKWIDVANNDRRKTGVRNCRLET